MSFNILKQKSSFSGSYFILGSSSKSRLHLLNKIGYKPDLILSPNIDESILKQEKPRLLSQRLSWQKSLECYNTLIRSQNIIDVNKYKNIVILSADTVCSLGSRVIDKALNDNDVANSLRKLSGRNHVVYTSITILEMKVQDFINNIQEYQMSNNISLDGNKNQLTFFSNAMFNLDFLNYKHYDKKNLVNIKKYMPSFAKISYLTTQTRIKFKQLNDIEVLHFVESKEGLFNAGGYAIAGIAESFVVNLVGSYSSVMGLPTYQTERLLQKSNVLKIK